MTTSHPRGIRRARPCGGGHPIGVSPAIVRAETPRAWVRVTCPTCGVVRVRSDHVVIRNCLDDQSWSYRARCSGCDVIFVAATPSVLAFPAVAAGIAVELWSLPQPSHRRPGEPLHVVDALELHLALLEPDWFDELVRVEPLEER